MYLLYEAVSDAVKAETACSLYQYHLIMECVKDWTIHESIGVSEEILLLYLYHVSARG